MSEKDDSVVLRKRLDDVVLRLTEMIKADVYENIIVATVRDWFEGNESVIQLNDAIRTNVQKRWPFVERKIAAELYEFQQKVKVPASACSGPDVGRLLNEQGVSEAVGQTISAAIGAIGTALVAMVSGGAGTALIAAGPVGWVIGAIIGALAFFLGKSKIEKEISSRIADKRIPAFLKKAAKSKVAAQLKLGEAHFEEQVYGLLREKLGPLYDMAEHGLDQ